MLPTVLACAALTLPHRPMPSLERAHLAAPLAARPARAGSPLMADPWAASSGGIDWNTVLGVGVALGGIFGGIALISFTENAGKRNEELANAQPCVECKGEKVVECTICKGSGVDPLASLVRGVRQATGDLTAANVVKIEDWATGPKEVIMFEDILSKYPIKVSENVCLNCEGRGVVVCDNCRGTGIQPRFLERFGPDDFMD
mmetsp:Transcript_4190/g.12996  ORF Transcript_4190/g.12996 Transcript_4190/m.12996 type:complete len:202 (-) Transcript_4190:654-1259(-)